MYNGRYIVKRNCHLMMKRSKKQKNYKNHPEIYAVYYHEDHTIYVNKAYTGVAGCPIILVKPDKTEEEN